MKPRKMRLLALTLALSMILVIFAACAPTPSSPTGTSSVVDASQPADAGSEGSTEVTPEGKTEIRFSWWGGDGRHEATIAAVDAFMLENPDIIVKVEYGAWDGWSEKVATQLSGGTAPDIMQINWNWLYQLSSDGSKFVDLREYGEILDLSGYEQTILNEGIVADKQQGLPVGMTAKAFFWNKTTFEKAGLAVPTTFAEVMAAGPIFKEKLGDNFYPIGMYEYERMILMLYFLESKYGKDWALDNQLNYSVEEVKEGLDWIRSLEDNHVLPSIATIRGDGANTLEKNIRWIDGSYGGFYEWDSTQQKLSEALEEGQEFVLGEFPRDLGDTPAALSKVTMCYAITESSKNKEAAARLLEFLSNSEAGVQAIGTQRGMLANSNANAMLEAAGELTGLTFEANQKAMALGGFGMDPNFENAALKDTTGVYYDVMERLSNGEDTAELAQYLHDTINEVYADNQF